MRCFPIGTQRREWTDQRAESNHAAFWCYQSQSGQLLVTGVSRDAGFWSAEVPPVDRAVLRAWTQGGCPSYVLADWLEEQRVAVPADVLAMLREPQENAKAEPSEVGRS